MLVEKKGLLDYLSSFVRVIWKNTSLEEALFGNGIILWIRYLRTVFDFLFVKGFNGYVFAHIVCGSTAKLGGFEVQSSEFMSLLSEGLPQIQDPGYQISPNLCSCLLSEGGLQK